MQRRKFLGGFAAASLGLVSAGPASKVARAYNKPQASADSSVHTTGMRRFAENSTIVLVHGAWADGSCWRNVIRPLERRGLQVICAPLPMTSLTNDTAALTFALQRTTGPVILVGHAYSGAVIAAVQEPRVRSLVYISALAPDQGETVAKVFYLNPNSPQAPKMVPDAHGFVWLPEDAFHQALAQNTSRDEAEIAAAVQRPLGVQCIQQAAPKPLWRSKPSWFLIAEEDRMISPKTARFMADRMHAKAHSAPVDHTPMYSAPEVVIDMILEAAHSTLAA